MLLTYARNEVREMPRPCKLRWVGFDPEATRFKPCGMPLRDLETVTLTLDELEAIRLADVEGLYQEDAAQRMNVSRPTFGNIITAAHGKVADFLVNTKCLIIEGGNIMVTEREFTCSECGHKWSVPFGAARPNACPKCCSTNFHRSDPQTGCGPGRGRGYGRGQCGRQGGRRGRGRM
jgi:predicted DNA-binding protein (UPF0251 family)